MRTMCSLRVLLIRKDFKLFGDASISGSGLRVLLIRKDFKPTDVDVIVMVGLRVLLIRKDFKLMLKLATTLLV